MTFHLSLTHTHTHTHNTHTHTTHTHTQHTHTHNTHTLPYLLSEKACGLWQTICDVDFIKYSNAVRDRYRLVSSTCLHSENSGKCSHAKLLFHQQYYNQLFQFTQLEITPNFYAVRSTLWTSKISVNLLAQILLIDLWWNWHLRSISPMLYEQLLLAKIPKPQVETDDLTVFLRIWDLCASKLWVKCWLNWPLLGHERNSHSRLHNEWACYMWVGSTKILHTHSKTSSTKFDCTKMPLTIANIKIEQFLEFSRVVISTT